MRIFNQTKTTELNETTIDYGKGYLKPDKIVIAHHEAVAFKKGKTAQQISSELESQGKTIEIGYDGLPYLVVEEHDSGGRRVEAINPIPDTPAQDAYDDYEDIQVYVPYTEAELAQREITQLKQKLADTDYQAIKYAEGELSEYEYAPIKAQRAEWRRQINELEKKI